MSNRSLIHIPVLALLAGAVANCATPDNALDLWYRQPARNWNQALPVGNGRLAAMVFGDAAREHLQLNEDSIWSGTKRDRSNPEASKAFPEVRGMIEQGYLTLRYPDCRPYPDVRQSAYDVSPALKSRTAERPRLYSSQPAGIVADLQSATTPILR